MRDPVLSDLARYELEQDRGAQYAEDLAREMESVWKDQFPNGIDGFDIIEAIDEMDPDTILELYDGPAKDFGEALHKQIARYWTDYVRKEAESALNARGDE